MSLKQILIYSNLITKVYIQTQNICIIIFKLYNKSCFIFLNTSLKLVIIFMFFVFKERP